MEEKILEKVSCPVQLSLKVLGGKWKLVILHYLLDEKPKRFKELENIIGNISPRMLIKELKDLEKQKIIKREAFATVPPTVQYSLTEHGKSLVPIIHSIEEWGLKHAEIASL